ncbi:hypothetical protein [Pedobacter sp.]|uniref:hypothetical protein n=1 Tax=Pedobacter sp. TaxID=1411316 RepID=UPI003D7FBC01
MEDQEKEKSTLEWVKRTVVRLYKQVEDWMLPSKEQPKLLQVVLFLLKLPVLLLLLMLSPILLVILLLVFLIAL